MKYRSEDSKRWDGYKMILGYFIYFVLTARVIKWGLWTGLIEPFYK